MITIFRHLRAALCLGVLLLAVATVRAQVGNTACTPVPLGPLPPSGAPVDFTDNNTFGGSEPDIWPDCGGGANTRYYRFRLPPGYTNALVELQPLESRVFQLALLDSLACLLPGPDRFVPGTDACGTPGSSISIPAAGVCLSPGGVFYIKVSGQTGGYNLRVRALLPTCTDGCQNGTETGVDSLPPLNIFSSSLDSALCTGDALLLQVADASSYTSFVWNTGEVGPLLTVNKPGIYRVDALSIDGCVVSGTIRLRYRTDCVWPGDADRNRRVEARDVLPIGLGFGSTGPARGTAFPPLDFDGLSAPDWPAALHGAYGSLNLKNADADGSGVINEDDALAIVLNYGQVIPLEVDGPDEAGRWADQQRSSSSDPPLFLSFSADTIEAGDTLWVSVKAGTALEPISNLYGYGVNVTLPMLWLDSSYLELDFSDSWLDDDGQVYGYHQFVPTQGFVDVGYTRTDQTGRSGFGTLFSFGVIVVDNLDGARVTRTRSLPFDFANLLALDPGADSVLLRIVPDTASAQQFCDSRGLNSASEYIDAFRVNSKAVISGNNGGYRRLVVNANNLERDRSYTFGFRPGFSGPSAPQHWRAWLDINGDGDFSDEGEMLVNQVSSGIFQRSIYVPDTALLGWTTLRVQMKRADGIGPEPCEEFAFGEVEDFFVEIKENSSRLASQVGSLAVWPNPARDRVALSLPAGAGALQELHLVSAEGRLLRVPLAGLHPGREQGLVLDLGAYPRGWYAVQVLSESGVFRGRLLLVE